MIHVWNRLFIRNTIIVTTMNHDDNNLINNHKTQMKTDTNFIFHISSLPLAHLHIQSISGVYGSSSGHADGLIRNKLNV